MMHQSVLNNKIALLLSRRALTEYQNSRNSTITFIKGTLLLELLNFTEGGILDIVQTCKKRKD